MSKKTTSIKETYYKLNSELESSIQFVENEELFEKYNNIMDKLTEENISELEKNILTEKKITIRNKILIDNIPAFNKLISRRFTNINNPEEMEEIRHLGYILALEYIDENYLYKGDFKKNLSETIMIKLKRLLVVKLEGITIQNKEYLEKIKKLNIPIECISIKKIASELNIKYKKANNILNLMNIKYPYSLEQINYHNSHQNYILEDYFEEYIDIQSKKEIINKIIKLLPQNYQKIIILYFGLNNNKSYNIVQISKMTNLTKQRIFCIINESLKYLRNENIIKYLEEVSGKELEEQYITSNNCKLETNIIKNLPLNYHQELLKNLPNENYKKFYKLYFIDQYSIEEIIDKINISLKQANNLKFKILIIIQENLTNQIQNPSNINYSKYLEYLINIYLSKEISYQKRRIKK